MSNTPVMTSTGRAGHAARLAPASRYLVDHWQFMPAGVQEFTHAALLVDVEGGTDPRSTLQLNVYRLVQDGPDVPVAMMLMGDNHDLAREITRHLMRQAVHGQIPMPPDDAEDRRIWVAAAGINASFIERWGSLEDAERERC